MLVATKTGSGPGNKLSSSTALVDFAVNNNGSWNDAIRFGDEDDFSWSLEDKTFECDIQRNRYDTTPLLSLSTANGRIIVDSETLRVFHFDVTATDIQSHLPPGVYVYDFVMVDAFDITDRTVLMSGTLTITQGVTYP